MIYKKELLNANWYLNHMSMFLKESYGIKEQYQWFVDQLNSIDFVADNMLNVLDLYNVLWNKNNPWKMRIKFDDETEENVTFYSYEELVNYFDEKNIKLGFLDVIANLNDIDRQFIYTYNDVENDVPVTKKEVITLNNRDLYRYILISIAKNNYDGTFEMIKNTYNKVFGEEKVIYLTDNTSGTKLNVNIYILADADELNSDIIKAFKSDLFIIKSMGITYNLKLLNSSSEIFKLDKENNLDNAKYIL